MNKGSATALGPLTTTKNEYMSHILDLFSQPLTENALKPPGHDAIYHPINGISHTGPYTFEIGATNTDYILLDSIRLHGTASIHEIKDNALADDSTLDFSTVNYWPHALFKLMELKLNGVEINNNSTSTYGYKAYMEQLMSTSSSGYSTHKSPAWWYADTIDMNRKTSGSTADPIGDESTGFVVRKGLVTTSKEAHFSTSLHCDLFHTGKVLPPGVGISLKMLRQNDLFGIMAPTEAFGVKIKNLTLSVKRIQVTDEVLEAHARAWLKTDVIIPLIRSHITTHVINKGVTSVVFQGVASGVLPKQMLCAFVPTTAYEGVAGENPFKFAHHNVVDFTYYVNGERTPSESYDLDFPNGKYTRLYQDLVDKFGATDTGDGLAFGMQDFKRDYVMYPLSLSPDQCSMYHAHHELTGNIDLHIKFSGPVPNTLQLICYQAKSNRLFIDANRNVRLDVP